MYIQAADLQLTKDIAEIAEAVATVLGIGIGGFWSYRLFWLRRQRYPRVDIEHHVEAHSLSDEHLLLVVVITIRNTGDVLFHLVAGNVWVQKILPLHSEIEKLLSQRKDLIKEMRARLPDSARDLWQTEIAWPIVGDREIIAEKGHIEIEPGNETQVRCDFVLNRGLRVIKLYSFFPNPSKRPRRIRLGSSWRRWRNRRPIGWELATIHQFDLAPEKSSPEGASVK